MTPWWHLAMWTAAVLVVLLGTHAILEPLVLFDMATGTLVAGWSLFPYLLWPSAAIAALLLAAAAVPIGLLADIVGEYAAVRAADRVFHRQVAARERRDRLESALGTTPVNATIHYDRDDIAAELRDKQHAAARAALLGARREARLLQEDLDGLAADRRALAAARAELARLERPALSRSRPRTRPPPR